MNCKQKSGVFFNIKCQNTSVEKCTSCAKTICETHTHELEAKILCEDCYWETYLYMITKKQVDNYDDTILYTGSTYSSSIPTSNTTNPETGGFDEGFGGGEFGGGGATSSWSEGDIQSVNNSTENDSFLNNDETFFYS